jgi:hypothetical protein
MSEKKRRSTTIRTTSHTSLNPPQLMLCLFAKKMQERKRNSNSESLAQPVDFIELCFTFFKLERKRKKHTSAKQRIKNFHSVYGEPTGKSDRTRGKSVQYLKRNAKSE